MGALSDVWRRVHRACRLRLLCLLFVFQILLGLSFLHPNTRHLLPDIVETIQRASPLVTRTLAHDYDQNARSKVGPSKDIYKSKAGEQQKTGNFSGPSRELAEAAQKEVLYRAEGGEPEDGAEPQSHEASTIVPPQVQKKDQLFHNGQTFSLKDDHNEYFVSIAPGVVCYVLGTDLPKTNSSASVKSCSCKPKYYGADCGVPDAIWSSQYGKGNNHGNLKRRKVPRRVINGMPLLNEVDLLGARVNDLAGAVDLFLLAESNYSAHGDPKRLYIKEKLENGFLQDFHQQILHVYVDFFPEEGKRDSWFADRYLRIYMGKLGIPRILGIRSDDLFVLNDADEIPSREVIMFLKLYDGYSEPIALAYRWSVYGFFFKNLAPSTAVSRLLKTRKELTTTVRAVATMGFVSEVLENDPFMIRNKLKNTKAKLLGAYTRKHPNQFGAWTAGKVGSYCGWHCSWCFQPEGIVLKLDSAQAGDRPRWGDYPEKHDRRYLQGLIKEGRWFDGSKNTKLVPPNEPSYAPPYLLLHASRFRSILFHPEQTRMFPDTASYVDSLLRRNESSSAHST